MSDGTYLKVVRGDPTPEEIAALVTVLTARAAAARPGTPGRRSAWSDPSLLMRRPFRHGPGAWRSAG